MKKVIEVRGADCNGAAITGGLAALWRGVLYDASALAEAEQLWPKLTYVQHLELHAAAREKGLRARRGKQRFGELATELIAIARRGLQRLDPEDAPLLEPLALIAASGQTPAEAVLREWESSRDPVKLLQRFEL